MIPALPKPLTFYRPTDLTQAQRQLARFPDAVLLAGGQHLIPRWKDDKTPSTVVSLEEVTALQNIRHNADTLEIGAGVTLAELASSKTIRDTLPSLADLASKMGDRFMRNRATIGGALCSTHVAGCIPAAVLGSKATIHTTERTISANEWFASSKPTFKLAQSEILTKISLQIPDAATHQYLRIVPGRFALITIFATRTQQNFGVGISGLGTSAFCSETAESWLAQEGTADEEELSQLFLDDVAQTDFYADDNYRKAQARRLLKRAAELIRS